MVQPHKVQHGEFYHLTSQRAVLSGLDSVSGSVWLINGVCPSSEAEPWYPEVQRSAILLLKTVSRKEPGMEVKGYTVIQDPSTLVAKHSRKTGHLWDPYFKYRPCGGHTHHPYIVRKWEWYTDRHGVKYQECAAK